MSIPSSTSILTIPLRSVVLVVLHPVFLPWRGIKELQVAVAVVAVVANAKCSSDASMAGTRAHSPRAAMATSRRSITPMFPVGNPSFDRDAMCRGSLTRGGLPSIYDKLAARTLWDRPEFLWGALAASVKSQ